MRTISKDKYGVAKQLTKGDKSMFYGFVARGSRKQCYKYIIKLAEDAQAKAWDRDVQLSLHVFPKSDYAFLHVYTYKEEYEVESRIEYQIGFYKEDEKKETKKK